MRVTKIPGDHHDIGDRPCNVYLNEVPVSDWIVADDFRRVVETKDGPRFGSVRIELAEESGQSRLERGVNMFPIRFATPEPILPEGYKPAEEAATHLCGVFVPEPKPEAPAIEIVEAEPEQAKPAAKPRTARRKARK
jgi:hypothetical protein